MCLGHLVVTESREELKNKQTTTTKHFSTLTARVKGAREPSGSVPRDQCSNNWSKKVKDWDVTEFKIHTHECTRT